MDVRWAAVEQTEVIYLRPGAIRPLYLCSSGQLPLEVLKCGTSVVQPEVLLDPDVLGSQARSGPVGVDPPPGSGSPAGFRQPGVIRLDYIWLCRTHSLKVVPYEQMTGGGPHSCRRDDLRFISGLLITPQLD